MTEWIVGKSFVQQERVVPYPCVKNCQLDVLGYSLSKAHTAEEILKSINIWLGCNKKSLIFSLWRLLDCAKQAQGVSLEQIQIYTIYKCYIDVI